MDDVAATFTVIDTLLDEVITAAEDERTRIEAYGLFESGPELRLANRAPILCFLGITGNVSFPQTVPPNALFVCLDKKTPRH